MDHGIGSSRRRDGENGNEPSTSRQLKQPHSSSKTVPRKAVPPGYLHDLLHSRHLMKTVGLRKQTDSRHAIPNPLAGVPNKTSRTSYQGHRYGHQKRGSKAATPKLPELFRQRKLYLERRKNPADGVRREDKTTTTSRASNVARGREAGGDDACAVNLLSLPEELLLKIMCYLTHEEAKPLFLVCKELSETLKSAIKFHFNFATPMAMAAAKGESMLDDNKRMMAIGRRPQKKRAVTAYADVLGHLKKGGQRNVIEKEAPTSSTHSLAAPRALMFNTPQTTPTSLQQQQQLLPALSGVSTEAAVTPVDQKKTRARKT